MTLAESIGPGGWKVVNSEYFPYLPILDTEEILERIGKEWKNPGKSDRHDKSQMDSIFREWIDFCNEALMGYEAAQRTIKKGEISMDLESAISFVAFYHALEKSDSEKKEKYPKIITSVRDAFILLLSDKTRKDLNIGKPQIKVDQPLRNKINTLIKSMGRQAEGHHHRQMKKLAEFDDD